MLIFWNQGVKLTFMFDLNLNSNLERLKIFILKEKTFQNIIPPKP
jgi:hypothetical protein